MSLRDPPEAPFAGAFLFGPGQFLLIRTALKKVLYNLKLYLHVASAVRNGGNGNPGKGVDQTEAVG
jgi:hypothetical protein